MSVSVGCYTGIANGQDLATSERDSLTAAFFLLKFDHEVLSAKAEADSVNNAWAIERLEAGYKRQALTVLATAIVSFFFFWAGSRLE